MNQYFAYIRVSTARQGEQGVSLQQQREAIQRHAQRSGLEICRWFEEQETAAKQGRPLFNEMIKLLKARKVSGVIIHKIDRSARNLRDWSALGELIDQGVDVHFANESLDMRSRGGRLSADIQAVVAADYIRNLREETKKGFYGRLKQGLYPMPAPLGYLNIGKGQPKQPNPVAAPLVRNVFELYASGRYNFKSLRAEVTAMGLKTRSGKPITLKGLSTLLHNTFYIGLIHIERTNETYKGVHEPIVPKSLFDRVQDILSGRLNSRVIKHDFLFRRRLACRLCGNSMIGETHKGYIYYRCQTAGCPTTSIREDYAESVFLRSFAALKLADEERRYLWQKLRKMKDEDSQNQANSVAALELQLVHIDERLNRLTDAYIDRLIEKDLFEQRKNALLLESATSEENLRQWQSGKKPMSGLIAEFLERANGAYSAYTLGKIPEKRDLVDSMFSYRLVEQKTLNVSLRSPFHAIANRAVNKHGSPHRTVSRIWASLLPILIALITTGDDDAHRLAA